MQYRVAAVGRRAQDPWVEAADKYLKRLNRYARAELILVRDSNAKAEGNSLLSKVEREDYVFVLDERGQEYRTLEFSDRLRELASNRRICFLVGGADGFSTPVRHRASELLSLSKFTLPHRLAWAILIEQLYRAHTIMRGERYHRESP